jgi:hypothetical protein
MSVPDQALPQTSQVTGPIGAWLRGGGDATARAGLRPRASSTCDARSVTVCT